MRLFVTFHPYTTVHGKVMVFTDMTRNQVQDTMVTYYGNSWHMIYSEQDLAQLFPNIFNCTNQWIPFGTKVVSVFEDKQVVYPLKYEPKHSVTLESITEWFKIAKPEPKSKDVSTQLGAMYEEVAESISALSKNITYMNLGEEKADLHNALVKAHLALNDLSFLLYKDSGFDIDKQYKIDLLDALADITVTTTGSAHMLNLQWDKALTEVNKSNFSKFENNKPVLNQDGKIIKGKDYFKPNLEEFV